MRKLIIILLIAVIACAEVTPKEKACFGENWDKVKEAVFWLKDNQIWSQLVTLAKCGSKLGVLQKCSLYFSFDLCEPIKDGVYKIAAES